MTAKDRKKLLKAAAALLVKEAANPLESSLNPISRLMFRQLTAHGGYFGPPVDGVMHRGGQIPASGLRQIANKSMMEGTPLAETYNYTPTTNTVKVGPVVGKPHVSRYMFDANMRPFIGPPSFIRKMINSDMPTPGLKPYKPTPNEIINP